MIEMKPNLDCMLSGSDEIKMFQMGIFIYLKLVVNEEDLSYKKITEC